MSNDLRSGCSSLTTSASTPTAFSLNDMYVLKWLKISRSIFDVEVEKGYFES